MGQDIALPAGQQRFSLPHRPALVGKHQLPQPTSKQRETARNNAATADFGVFLPSDPEINRHHQSIDLFNFSRLGISPLMTTFLHAHEDPSTSPYLRNQSQQPTDVELGSRTSGDPMTLAIPQFDDYGYLQAGVHNCTFLELESLLGWNESRLHLLRQLQQFIAEQLVP